MPIWKELQRYSGIIWSTPYKCIYYIVLILVFIYSVKLNEDFALELHIQETIVKIKCKNLLFLGINYTQNEYVQYNIKHIPIVYLKNVVCWLYCFSIHVEVHWHTHLFWQIYQQAYAQLVWTIIKSLKASLW